MSFWCAALWAGLHGCLHASSHFQTDAQKSATLATYSCRGSTRRYRGYRTCPARTLSSLRSPGPLFHTDRAPGKPDQRQKLISFYREKTDVTVGGHRKLRHIHKQEKVEVVLLLGLMTALPPPIGLERGSEDWRIDRWTIDKKESKETINYLFSWFPLKGQKLPHVLPSVSPRRVLSFLL